MSSAIRPVFVFLLATQVLEELASMRLHHLVLSTLATFIVSAGAAVATHSEQLATSDREATQMLGENQVQSRLLKTKTSTEDDNESDDDERSIKNLWGTYRLRKFLNEGKVPKFDKNPLGATGGIDKKLQRAARLKKLRQSNSLRRNKVTN